MSTVEGRIRAKTRDPAVEAARRSCHGFSAIHGLLDGALRATAHGHSGGSVWNSPLGGQVDIVSALHDAAGRYFILAVERLPR